MSMIGDWFRRLLGGEDAPPSAPPARPKQQPPRKPSTPGELSIDDAPPARTPPKAGGAGFDPYSSDAGYQKPHSWERVDHD